MKVLLATDGSPNAIAAARTLAGRAYKADSVVRVVSVYEPLVPLRPNEEKAHAAIEGAIKELEGSPFAGNVSGEALDGSPVQKILELSESWQPDIIFIGAHARRDPINEALLGSVANDVLKRAHCTTLVVRGDQSGQFKPETRHLICVDGTPITSRVLSLVEREVANPETEFMIMHVLEAPSEPFSENPREDALIAQFHFKEMRSKIEATINECIASLRSALPGHSINSQIVEDLGVVETVLEFAKSWQADVISVGTHQRKGAEKFFLGSVSEAVCLAAHCSVEIVR